MNHVIITLKYANDVKLPLIVETTKFCSSFIVLGRSEIKAVKDRAINNRSLKKVNDGPMKMENKFETLDLPTFVHVRDADRNLL